MQKQRLSTSDVEDAVVRYNELQQKKKSVDRKFNDAKKKFYSIMDNAFDSGLFGEDVSSVEFSKVYNYGEHDEKTFSFKATRVIPTVIEWDIKKLKDKLRKKLSKGVLNKVVKRNRELVDLQGLVNYFKDLGGDPKVFWSFFETTEVVDQKILDQLEEVGDIEAEDVAGCFEVKVKSQSYRVTSKEVEDDGEEEA